MDGRNKIAELLMGLSTPQRILCLNEKDDGKSVRKLIRLTLELWMSQNAIWSRKRGKSVVVLPDKGYLFARLQEETVSFDEFKSLPAWRVSTNRFVVDDIGLFAQLWDEDAEILKPLRKAVPASVLWAGLLVEFAKAPDYSTVLAFDRLAAELLSEKNATAIAGIEEVIDLITLSKREIKKYRDKLGAPRKLSNADIESRCNSVLNTKRKKLNLEELVAHLCKDQTMLLKQSQLKKRIKELPAVMAKLTRSTGGRPRKLGTN